MNNRKQEVVWYFNYASTRHIYEDIKRRIEDGYRVHTCLERECDVLIVYEKYETDKDRGD